MTIKQSNYLKLVAIISMFIDHLGVFIFPDIILFRIIGRAAFPLFAYQLGIGYEKTKNLRKYVMKILLFGVVSQIIKFIFRNDLSNLNIFFTLALGLIAIYFFDNKKYLHLYLILTIPLLLKLEYGLYGIVLILGLYKYKNHGFKLFCVMAAINLFYCVYHGNYVQMFSLISIFFILKPISLKWHMPSYIFYLFYPLHLLILYAISVLI